MREPESARPNSDSDQVIERVTEELSVLQIDDAIIETVPESLEDADPGTPIAVRVRIDIDSVSWVPGYFHFGQSEIFAESSMRRESTN